MKRIPASVKVGVHTYSVSRVSEKEIRAITEHPANGCCDLNDNIILLRKGMPLGKSQEMLLHEILHACTYPALTAEKKKYTDEEFVETVAPLLLQVIKQNPQLLVYLMQEEEVAI